MGNPETQAAFGKRHRTKTKKQTNKKHNTNNNLEIC
jgi:hypothetical protein